jgi:hypothetical protein
MNTNEKTFNEYLKMMEIDHGPLMEKAANAKVDVTKVLQETYEKYADYAIQTAFGRGVTRLESETEFASSRQVVGLLVGMADSAKRNSPIMTAVIGADKRNYAVVIGWTPEVDLPDKSKKVTVPWPSKIKFSMVEKLRKGNTQGIKDYWMTGILEAVKVNSTPEILESLNKLQAVRPLDDLMKTKQNQIVVTKFKVNSVQAATMKVEKGADLRSGEGDEGTVERKPLPLFVPDLQKIPSYHPQLIFSGNTPDGNKYWFYLEPARVIAKLIDVADLRRLCEEAVTEFPTTPNEQAGFVEGALRGRELVAVIQIWFVDPEGTDRYPGGSVRGSIISLFEVPMDVPVETIVNEPQQRITAEVEEKKITEDKKSEEISKEGTDEGQTEEEGTEEGTEEEAEGENQEVDSPPEAIENIQNNIKFYAKLLTGQKKATKQAIRKLNIDDLINKHHIHVHQNPDKTKVEYSEATARQVFKDMCGEE